jgi:predicted AAA+ superfamily ATPase
MQQLLLNEDNDIYYWTNEHSTAEVDFVIQNEDEIIPVEVKSGTNTKSASFKFFCEKYQLAKAIRASLNDYKQEEWMVNIPLYAINSV